jgi:hypothetical protein
MGADERTEKAVIGNGNEVTQSVSSGDQYLFLVWPVTVVHRIDERSPFWDISAEQVRQHSLYQQDIQRLFAFD